MPLTVAYDLITCLREAFARPLPGFAGQMGMAPTPRPVIDPSVGCSTPCREAAVVALLYPGETGWCLVLTLRTETLPSHQGQISLPGGRIEAGETIEETALRELQEELAVDPDSSSILGHLTPLYIEPSHYHVHPLVAFTPDRPLFRPAFAEVSEVIEMPLSALLDPATRRSEVRQLRGQPTEVPYFSVGSHKVWGATAMILSELVEMLNASACDMR